MPVSCSASKALCRSVNWSKNSSPRSETEAAKYARFASSKARTAGPWSASSRFNSGTARLYPAGARKPPEFPPGADGPKTRAPSGLRLEYAGHRSYDCAVIDLVEAWPGRHRLLICRNRTTGELAYHRCFSCDVGGDCFQAQAIADDLCQKEYALNNSADG
jgi:hypothetical protein